MRPTQLAFSVITDSHHKSIFELGQLFEKTECSIHQFHIHSLGDSLNACGLASGAWKHIALLEMLLNEFSEKNQWDFKVWRLKELMIQSGVPYALEAVFLEDKGVTIVQIFEMLSLQDIIICSYSYEATTLDSEHLLAKVQIAFKLPFNGYIQALRERFYNLCDNLNIDGSIELCRA